jgi:hypothetical protein
VKCYIYHCSDGHPDIGFNVKDCCPLCTAHAESAYQREIVLEMIRTGKVSHPKAPKKRRRPYGRAPFA